MAPSYPVEGPRNCKIGKGVAVIDCDGDKQILDEIPVGVTYRHKRFVGGLLGDYVGGLVGDYVGGLVGDYVGDKVEDAVGRDAGALAGAAVRWFMGDTEQEPPNTPPWVVTPGIVNSLIYIPKGSTNASVHPPTYTNGGRYTEGTHTVHFVGYDTKGYSAYTSITFKVQAIRCVPFSQPENGVLKCNNVDIVEGTICEVNCYEGYDIRSEEREIECVRQGANGQPSKTTTDCKPIKCSDAPTVSHGKLSGADGQRIFTGVYDAVCDQGYYAKTSGSATCNEHGEWTKVPECHGSLIGPIPW
ncbi:hypothetical protein DPMN_187604 [Dreissena polymorpha]|uniref:Sushi domain-containing protein n=1 Tax=Dreissena polymorpha TaxID=45954 RepID=A0A9D4DRX1_DREPO|nr:hypothetical protein DPMN_187604 [Dreissena polymorpha]